MEEWSGVSGFGIEQSGKSECLRNSIVLTEENSCGPSL